MIKDLHPTTRRFPRTLYEAFPQDPHLHDWIEPPPNHKSLQDILLATAGFFIWLLNVYLIWGY
jgi:hypothetical protein